jgi:hypothetical protein
LCRLHVATIRQPQSLDATRRFLRLACVLLLLLLWLLLRLRLLIIIIIIIIITVTVVVVVVVIVTCKQLTKGTTWRNNVNIAKDEFVQGAVRVCRHGVAQGTDHIADGAIMHIPGANAAIHHLLHARRRL